MFFTRPEYSEWLPPLEGYRNCSGWRIVELAAQLPWFLLEVSVRDDRGQVEGSRTLLVGRMATLVDALGSMRQAKSARVLPSRVLGFYPPRWVEAAESWSTREIVEIWDGQVEGEEAPHSIWLLRSRDGQELVEPEIDASLQVRKVRQIFGAPGAR